MKKITFAAVLMIGILFSAETKAQLQFENTFGLLLNDPTDLTVLRGTVALNNLFKVSEGKTNKFNIGVYYTTELCCAFSSKTVSKSDRDDTRKDLAGLNLRFFNRLTLFGGVGLFRNGVFSGNGSLRKELGLGLQIPKYNMSVSASLGDTKGPSLNVGYFVPIKKTKS
jgi:hypothetical protein